MNVIESRLVDAEHEINDLDSNLSQVTFQLNEVRKQNSQLIAKNQNNLKEILLLRGQVKRISQDNAAKDNDISLLRQTVCIFITWRL